MAEGLVQSDEAPGVLLETEGDRAALLHAYPEAQAWNGESMFFGGVHAVRREAKGGFEAAGDPRRAGVAIYS